MGAHTVANMATSLLKRQSGGSSSSTSNSASSVVSTLAPVALYALIYAILFLVLRRPFKRYYQPRTFLGSLRPEQRSPKLPDSMFGWVGTFWKIPDTYVLNHHSLDSYLFLRFLKIAVVCCIVGCLITWSVLFPVFATGGAGKKQLDIITFSNQSNYWTYFAPCGCAMLYFGFIMYMITRESVFYINLRQAYLMSPLYSSRISSRTVLFTSVPAQYMNEQLLTAVLGHGVRRMWFTSDTKDLEDKVKERDQAAYKLEGAETKLIVSANKQRLKNEKAGHRAGSDEEAAIGQGSGSAAARYLKPKQRPTHRLKPIIGKKVDTIDWCRAELKKLIPEVDRMQSTEKAGQGKMTSSVFVEFETLSEAQAAYQSLTHHQALHMSPRFTGINPAEIIWSSLKIKWWELIIRKLATTAFVVALIIFWAIPVAAVGAISNINKLEGTTGFTWLHKIFDPIPSVIMGVITGLLPVVLLAVLMALLPIILRAMAKLGGDPTKSAVELTVQNTYFAFQVVQVFLVATLGSAATSVGGAIAQNPSSAVSVLANNLPQASTFYLSYFLLQGLGVVSGLLVGLVGLVIFMVLGKLLDSTPRKMYKRWISLSGLGWGTVFPIYTNLFVIAICYAAIAPLVLGFAAIGLFLFYIAYRYNLLFVTDASVDTKGRVYPRALQQIFVGLYLAEACLIGLFGIGLGKSIGALGPMILMILMLVFTVLYQSSLNAALTPLIDYLPKTIDAEERRLLAEEIGADGYDAVPNKEAQFAHARPANGPAPRKKPNFLSLWLRPDIYQDYETMRRMVPKDIAVHYTQEEEQNAFFNPAITQATPLLWIPRDGAGISHQEVRDTRQVMPVTDDGAFLDDKGKIVWDSQDGRPPIYEEVPYY
ncbi:phosphate metabolism protein 7 [Friedmanniomyces endolithicus]|nr:phosphate metabolism protein 7 [Friedmanniomyces endolithicus]KAK0989912.1 phosphate metabolism protein 7 [Friedmanniomyces endolithicus]KAK1037907.1 phosphate metabolism protein 7 [Friedmanniomyces endolithicus]